MRVTPDTYRLMFVANLALGSFANTNAHATDVRLTLVDGQSLTGEWLAMTSDGTPSIEIRTDGVSKSIPTDSIMAVDYSHESITPTAPTNLYIADGGRLVGELTGGTSTGITANTILGESGEFPFDCLAAIQFTTRSKFERAAELFQEAIDSRLPGQDILVTRGVEDVKSLRGRVESLMQTSQNGDDSDERAKGVFIVGDRSRTFLLQKVYGIVFAAGAAKPLNYNATIYFIDGSRCSGWLDGGSQNHLQFKSSLAATFTLALGVIQRIELRGDRIIYLSELTPVDEKNEGLLSRPWPWQRDRSVGGKPLMLNGKMFPKGIGVRARSELTYALNGEYACFAATIGIDDSVRPRGNVVCRVTGDDKLLYESGSLSGQGYSKDFAVDVTGVKKLTLVTDFADQLDLSDHTNWAGARLLKKNPDGSSPCAQK